MTAMLTTRVAIVEETDRWRIKWPDAIEYRATAAEALNAVKARGAVLAEGGTSTVHMIEWTTHSRIGAMVVRALR